MIRNDFYSDKIENEIAEIIDKSLAENKCYQLGALLDKYVGYNPPETIKWLSPKDLIDSIDWSASKIRSYNKILLTFDLVEITGLGKYIRYRITQKGLKFRERFCSHCMNGRLVIEKKEKYENELKCSYCGIGDMDTFCVNCGTKRPFSDEKGHFICGTSEIQRFLLRMNKKFSGWVCSKECEMELVKQVMSKKEKVKLKENEWVDFDKYFSVKQDENGNLEICEKIKKLTYGT